MLGVTFCVEGDPKPQPRPRAFARQVGGVAVARVYDAGTAEGWKARVVVAGAPHRPPSPIVDPLQVEIHFRFARPKGHYRTGKNAHLLASDSPVCHSSKPDLDNLAKAVLDALTQDGWWRDDSQINGIAITKRWIADASERPGCSISISW